jgi:ribulose-phosphate 3-epimerase
MFAQTVLTAPSLLSADFADMASGLQMIHDHGGDWVHLDVMDGQFVPNITFGPKMVADIRKRTSLPLDVHLMINTPELIIDRFIDAGADHVTFHYEASVHSHRLLQYIRSRGKKAGLSIVPASPVSFLDPVLPYLDLILIMTVNPGFGGQKIIPECLRKVSYLRDMRKKEGHKYRILVDGGVNRQTAADVRNAGTDVLVTGSAFFAAEFPGDFLLALKGQKVV